MTASCNVGSLCGLATAAAAAWGVTTSLWLEQPISASAFVNAANRPLVKVESSIESLGALNCSKFGGSGRTSARLRAGGNLGAEKPQLFLAVERARRRRLEDLEG